MALNLNEIFSPAAIAAYWTNDPTNAQPYASDALFPARKKVSMELKWLRGHKGVGVSLKPSVFDAKATFRTRQGIKMTETSMPFFREGTHIDEEDRRKIISVLATIRSLRQTLSIVSTMIPHSLLLVLALCLSEWCGSFWLLRLASPASPSNLTA